MKSDKKKNKKQGQNKQITTVPKTERQRKHWLQSEKVPKEKRLNKRKSIERNHKKKLQEKVEKNWAKRKRKRKKKEKRTTNVFIAQHKGK